MPLRPLIRWWVSRGTYGGPPAGGRVTGPGDRRTGTQNTPGRFPKLHCEPRLTLQARVSSGCTPMPVFTDGDGCLPLLPPQLATCRDFFCQPLPPVRLVVPKPSPTSRVFTHSAAGDCDSNKALHGCISQRAKHQHFQTLHCPRPSLSIVLRFAPSHSPVTLNPDF